ncbi:MAG: hypothetical protein M1837_004278 [Sclerophora amabilis]|nr:MAG: hypothetical protein M1837_004278 [Sclerophora amabilis]
MLLVTRDDVTPNKGPKFAVTVIVMPIIAAVFVLVRLASRWSRLKVFGLDDYSIVVALILSVLVTVMDCKAVHSGYGKHAANLTAEQLRGAFKYFYLAQPFYKVGICFTKLSILFLYNRIFIHVRFRRINFSVVGFVFAYSVAFLFLTIFQCVPIRRSWDKTTPGTCVSNAAQWFSFAIINIISDVIIIALPLPMIQQLHLPRNQKIALSIVFMFGIFVCMTSIMRMVAMRSGVRSTDPTYGTVEATKWTDIELNTGIICACLPALKAPLTRPFPRLFSGGSGLATHKTGLSGTTYSLEGEPPHSSSSRVEAFRDIDQLGIARHHHKRSSDGHIPSPVQGTSNEERIIAPNTAGASIGGIMKTTVVSVHYDKADSSASSPSPSPSPSATNKCSETS